MHRKFLVEFFSTAFVNNGTKNVFSNEGVLQLVEVWLLTFSKAIKFFLNVVQFGINFYST